MAGVIFQYPCKDGTTGMELKAMRHNYSCVAPSYGCSLANAVLLALDEAAACAPRETRAATKIQATFRMHQQAKAFRNIRNMACTIQRVYRGYSTRRHLQHERATTQRTAYLQAVFDMFATRIQALFRGYYSRKTRSNYYAQQAYINNVTARSLGVLEDAHRTRIEQDTLRTAESQRVQVLNYIRRTAQMHHTVSTSSIPSVYLRPPVSLVQTEEVGETASADYALAQAAVLTAGEQVENDILQNSRAARLNRAETLRKLGVTSGALLRSAATTTAPQAATTDKKRLPTATAPSQVPRLPALDASARKQRVRNKVSSAGSAEGDEPKIAPVVSWENASATAPQRPLIEKAYQHSSSPSHNTASAPVSTTAGSGPLSTEAKSVSSFHRKFGVRPHDCIGPSVSLKAIATQNGIAAVTFPGPLSMEKERAALEHSVNQKVVKSIHGNTVFKVPAAHGKRT
ncbi:hypothetical protein ABL78_6802 [Leptomonas seymouri]|uniref:IQ calmodulin-binding motif family protein n=1 Tax=Leptomonas seymouri TaxID=5684 RepID=A0A0N0P3I2_LEPSE|nr:hypothetical protein ABL78_6802 [Leptomonas seymouri]|eukprot:KPI84156.1 hypothetical protein ABL78_6802 [Leptomonas seymouri]